MAINVPFEPQLFNDETQRSCVAAALVMAYRAFGVTCEQGAIWRAISAPSPTGGLFAKTHVAVANARHHGLRALAIKAVDPVRATKRLLQVGICVVMNPRVDATSPRGHFTVAFDCDDEGIHFHDPEKGPNQYLSNKELEELWRPTPGVSEISGQMLIAVTNQDERASCQSCGAALPKHMRCKRCGEKVWLTPPQALGCVREDCTSRLYQGVLCPKCDAIQTV